MKTTSIMAAAFTALTLVACTEGGDVYVTEPNKPAASSSALGCMIKPGDWVCDRVFDSVAEADLGRLLDTLQAVSDLAGATDRATTELEAVCRGIVTEISGTLPPLGPTSTMEARLGILCGAAHDAIVTAEPGALRIDIAPTQCADSPPLTCTAPAVLPPPPCAPPMVTVSTTDGASAAAAAVAPALSHHYAAVLAVKGLFSKLASLANRIGAGADSLVLLPPPCVPSSAKLAADALNRIEALSRAANLVEAATAQVSQ